VGWLGVLMTVPVLTMRSFSEEQRSGTLETLLTAPVRDGEVVLAKFLGVFTVYLGMWLPTLAYFPILRQLGAEGLVLNPGALSSLYLGLALVGSLFLSIGLLCSALTRNLVVAAISCFACITLIFLAGFLPEVSPVPALREASAPFSPVLHLLEFCRGVVDSRAVVWYLSSTWLVLFCTVRVLESRRWRA
jgi:ABC-2 type transport system permease protein